jgi:transaldolase
MKFFIDTAVIDEIRAANAWGILDGVTTNPSLIAKAGKPFKEAILEICSIVNGPVNAEVTATSTKEMCAQGREYAKWHKNVVVKLPTTPDGIEATKCLSSDGIPTNLTLCFSATQALIVAKAGGAYVSPFVGRLDDISENGMELVRQIRTIYDNYGFKTQILAASIRHPMHVVEAAMARADIATIPFKILELLFKHPLTDRGLDQFLSDWKKAKQ